MQHERDMWSYKEEELADLMMSHGQDYVDGKPKDYSKEHDQ